MDIVHYKPEQLWDWLNDHGCEAIDISDESLDHQVVIYKGPTGKIVPIQIRKAYFPFYTCKICDALGIDTPNRFARHYEQLAELKRIQEEYKRHVNEKDEKHSSPERFTCPKT